MLWQKAVFVLGLAPSLGLTAKIPLLPNSRRDLGIWLIDADNMSGGQVELYQNTSDGGPLIQSIQAAFTVPNLTFASGQDASGAPYQLSLGCGISGTTIGSTVPCNNLGPRAGIHANVCARTFTTSYGLVSSLTSHHSCRAMEQCPTKHGGDGRLRATCLSVLKHHSNSTVCVNFAPHDMQFDYCSLLTWSSLQCLPGIPYSSRFS